MKDLCVAEEKLFFFGDGTSPFSRHGMAQTEGLRGEVNLMSHGSQKVCWKKTFRVPISLGASKK